MHTLEKIGLFVKRMFEMMFFFSLVTETMYRLCCECSSHQSVHAKKQKDYQVQDLETGRIHKVWVLCHDLDCFKHHSTYDEGMYIHRFSVLLWNSHVFFVPKTLSMIIFSPLLEWKGDTFYIWLDILYINWITS